MVPVAGTAKPLLLGRDAGDLGRRLQRVDRDDAGQLLDRGKAAGFNPLRLATAPQSTSP